MYTNNLLDATELKAFILLIKQKYRAQVYLGGLPTEPNITPELTRSVSKLGTTLNAQIPSDLTLLRWAGAEG